MTSEQPQSPTPASPLEEARRPTPWPLLLLAMALVIVPLIILTQIIAYYRTDVVDDQMFGYYGWRILHGATVYLDVWDNKPPAIYWTNALGFLIGADTYFGVIALCVVALVVAHAAFFGICNSLFYRGAAAFSTVLLSFFLMHAYFTGGTNQTETFLVPLELAAVFLYVRGYARDRWWKFYVAGVLCGGAFLYKQTGLAAWGSMGLHTIILVALRDVSVRTGFRRCLWLLAGAATTVVLAAVYLALQGALWEYWFAAFKFNQAYFDTGVSSFPFRYSRYHLLKYHMFPILRLPLLMMVAALIHAALWTLRPRFRPPEIEKPLKALNPACPHYMVLFATWFVVSFWGAMLSPHAFRHYLVPVIPPLMLMAAYLVNVLQAEMKLLVRLQQRAWVAAAFVAIGFFAWEAAQRQWEEVSQVLVFRFEQGERAEWEIIGDIVARVTEPDDEIQCWGYLPGVYLEARRANACRFTTTEKIGQVGGAADFVRKELQQALVSDPPAVLVMSAGEYNALSQPVPPDAPNWIMDLGAWIDEHYALIADVPVSNAIYVFKRKDLVRPQDSTVQDEVPALLRSH